MSERKIREAAVVFRREAESEADVVTDLVDALELHFPIGCGFEWKVVLPSVVHGSAPLGSETGRTTCCGRLPIELPVPDRISRDPRDVTCRG